MAVNDELGTRMKEYYEQVPKTRLVRKIPVAIRLDGKAFHTFTKGFKRPFDDMLVVTMQETMRYLCQNVQGCVLGYTQSDEITLILQDYKTIQTEAWFDYEVQKLCSIAASMATLAFNRYFSAKYKHWYLEYVKYPGEFGQGEIGPEIERLNAAYEKALERGAMFDARAFNVPKEEVTNLLYWRQLDAFRNSIQMVGQANFSDTQLHEKSCNAIQEMLMLEKGINWNDFETHLKRGSCCIKVEIPCADRLTGYKNEWVIDIEIPIFRGEGRNYIEDRIVF